VMLAPSVPVLASLTVTLPPRVNLPVPLITAPEVAPPSITSDAGGVTAPKLKLPSASVAPALTVKMPAAVAFRLADAVVVPDFISRLLKEVRMVAGKVWDAVNMRVPVPGVQVAVPLPMVTAPARLSVPPAVIFTVPFAPAMEPPITRLPALSIEPEEKVMVPLLPDILLPSTTAPETVRVEDPEKVSKPADAGEPVCPNCILVQAAFTLTVTVNPPSIVTTSPATGTVALGVPPEVADQVDVAFQLPVATANRLAAKPLVAVAPSKINPIQTTSRLCLICRIPILVCCCRPGAQVCRVFARVTRCTADTGVVAAPVLPINKRVSWYSIAMMIVNIIGGLENKVNKMYP